MFETHWSVIGAGPAGIAAVGQLLDRGVAPSAINWIDPFFSVGDLGQLWSSVPSNTSVRLFRRFLFQCQSFNIKNAPEFTIFDLSAESTCQLGYIVKPLQWVTQQLLNQVNVFYDEVKSIDQTKNGWLIQLGVADRLLSHKIILAQGAEPRPPLFDDVPTIDLATALNYDKLTDAVDNKDTIAVFGNSHSAVLALKHLVEVGVKRIFNFYRSDLCYAVFYDDWVLHDNTGLKGVAAEWARTHLEQDCPRHLHRIVSTTDNIAYYLPYADYAIYSIGFQSRCVPIEGYDLEIYNTKTGEIAPDLYGLGIAFPEVVQDRVGNIEARVGLWKFMEHIENNISNWLEND